MQFAEYMLGQPPVRNSRSEIRATVQRTKQNGTVKIGAESLAERFSGTTCGLIDKAAIKSVKPTFGCPVIGLNVRFEIFATTIFGVIPN